MPYPNEHDGGAEPLAQGCTSFPLSKALSCSRAMGRGKRRAGRSRPTSCHREDTAMGTHHLSVSRLLCCQWLPEAASLAQVFLSAVGNHGLASWEGGPGAQALPGEPPWLLELGPETLLLLPSQAPLSACHQNSIPSASPAVFGHSSLPLLKEQLVVAAYVSVCREREGGGGKGPSQQVLFLNVFGFFCSVVFLEVCFLFVFFFK